MLLSRSLLFPMLTCVATAQIIASPTALALEVTDDKIALCDIFSRVGFKIYSERVRGMSYDSALAALPAQTASLDQFLADQPAKLKDIHEIIRNILRKAYTSSWPSAEAFSDKERDVCLNTP